MPKRPALHRATTVSKLKHKQTAFIDQLTYVAAVIEPIITFPQVYAIWVGKDATGVSISSWLGYWILGIIWLYYGLVHRDKAIIIYQVLYTVLGILIVIGATMYGGHW